MSTPVMMTNCPSEETLAAFMDGRLDPESRRRVVEHIASCEDCYSIVSAAWEYESAATSAPVVRGRFGPVLYAAAALAAAVVAVVFLTPIRERFSFGKDDRRAALIAASDHLKFRSTEARVTGGFEYKPYRGPMRGDDDKSLGPEYWRIMQVSEEAALRAQKDPSPENLHLLGVSELLRRRIDEAVVQLELALLHLTGETDVLNAAKKSTDARLLTDLSAAYFSRYRHRTQSQRDLMRAGELASRARRLDPKSAEAVWNHALALQEIGVGQVTRDAWNDYLRVDPASPWANDVRQRLRNLESKPLSLQWKKDQTTLVEAARRGDAARVRNLVARYPEQSRIFVEENLLAEWAEAVSATKRDAVADILAIARVIAQAIADGPGDQMAADSVSTVAAVAYDDAGPLVDGHRAYLAGREAYRAASYEMAHRYLRHAADALGRGGSSLRFRAALYALTTEYYLGRLEDAVAHSRELRRMLEPISSRYPTVTGQTRWTSGLLALHLGHVDDALEHHLKALQAFERSGETSNLAGTAQAVSVDYRDVGDLENAWKYQLQAFRFADAFSSFDRAHDVVVGGALVALRDGYAALAHDLTTTAVRRARVTDHPMYLCDALLRASEIDAALGAPVSARSLIDEAASAWEKIEDSSMKSRLRADLEMVRVTVIDDLAPRERIAVLDRALQHVSNDRPRYANALLLRARAYAAAGDGTAAERDLTAGIAAVEAERSLTGSDDTRRAFLSTATALYVEMLRLRLARGAPEDAFDVSERARARWLLDRFTADQTFETARVLTLPELREHLPADTAIVSYVLSDRIDVWTVTRDAARHVQLPARPSAVALEIAAWRSAIAERNDRESERLASVVHDALIAPIRTMLGGANVVVVVPDGILNAVPFGALRPADTKRCLIEDVSVVIAPSANVFVQSLRRRSSPASPRGGILVVANPLSDDQESLPSAEDEGARVAAKLGAATLLRRADATVERVLDAASRAEIIHFGSHGVANVERPELSALILAPGPDGRSRLYARDIYRLKLPRTRLVMLAACESAHGDTARDAPLTLGTAFVAAGVPAVVATLWRVDDGAAADIVDAFYDELRRGADAASALRAAQLKALREGTGDSTWAAFQIIGS